MKLTKENSQLYRCQAGNESLTKVDSIVEASALLFECPAHHKDSRIDGHSIFVYFAAHPGGAPVAPPDCRPLPRWQVTGKDLSDITISPSINLDVVSEGCAKCRNVVNPCSAHPGAGRKSFPPGCVWHGFVRNGIALP